MPGFMFATGVENSYPVIMEGSKRVRVDEMDKCGHYKHWKEDLRLVREEMDLHYLRWGPAIYKTFFGGGEI